MAGGVHAQQISTAWMTGDREFLPLPMVKKCIFLDILELRWSIARLGLAQSRRGYQTVT